jgi:hypothetical protein
MVSAANDAFLFLTAWWRSGLCPDLAFPGDREDEVGGMPLHGLPDNVFATRLGGLSHHRL